MNQTGIFICENPASKHWALGPLAPAVGGITLIGWKHAADSVDSGVPKDVATVLARALTSISKVNFPVTEAGSGEQHHADDSVKLLGAGSWMERAAAALKSEPATIALVSTLHPETVMCLFEDTGFPWRLQSQVALFSACDAGPPDIDRKTLLSLIDENWVNRSTSLRDKGVIGVLRPGVDGDVACILSLTDAFSKAFVSALGQEVQAMDFNWRLVPEDVFFNQLATK